MATASTHRLLVTGCRHWRPELLVSHILCRLVDSVGAPVVVHGGATGIDAAFHEHASFMGLETEVHPADWKAHGRGAGPKRNQEMVDAGAWICLALHRDIKASRGTKDCARRAIAAGIRTWLIDSDAIPARMTRLHLVDLV